MSWTGVGRIMIYYLLPRRKKRGSIPSSKMDV